MKKKRLKKYVVWLNNYTDRRDDEWIVIYAPWPRYVKFLTLDKYDMTRFCIGRVMTAAQFRKEMGFSA